MFQILIHLLIPDFELQFEEGCFIIVQMDLVSCHQGLQETNLPVLSQFKVATVHKALIVIDKSFFLSLIWKNPVHVYLISERVTWKSQSNLVKVFEDEDCTICEFECMVPKEQQSAPQLNINEETTISIRKDEEKKDDGLPLPTLVATKKNGVDDVNGATKKNITSSMVGKKRTMAKRETMIEDDTLSMSSNTSKKSRSGKYKDRHYYLGNCNRKKVDGKTMANKKQYTKRKMK